MLYMKSPKRTVTNPLLYMKHPQHYFMKFKAITLIYGTTICIQTDKFNELSRSEMKEDGNSTCLSSSLFISPYSLHLLLHLFFHPPFVTLCCIWVRSPTRHKLTDKNAQCTIHRRAPGCSFNNFRNFGLYRFCDNRHQLDFLHAGPLTVIIIAIINRRRQYSWSMSVLLSSPK